MVHRIAPMASFSRMWTSGRFDSVLKRLVAAGDVRSLPWTRSTAFPISRCLTTSKNSIGSDSRSQQSFAVNGPATTCSVYQQSTVAATISAYDETPSVTAAVEHRKQSLSQPVSDDVIDIEVSADGRSATLYRQQTSRAAVMLNNGTDGTTSASDIVARYNATWLRHNCQCPRCVQKSSGQKLLRPAKMQPFYRIRSADVTVDSSVRITWEDDIPGHVTEIPISYLVSNKHTSVESRRRDSRPSAILGGKLPDVNYDELKVDDNADKTGSAGGEGLLRWLQQINNFGICVIRGVPTDNDGQVCRVAELICPIQSTIYGNRWDVRSEPNPINVAYSDAELDFHMDLSYYESPPGIQFLHCVQFDRCVTGGESVFVDAWYTAETMRTEYPVEFDTLTKVPATFQKIHFDRERPVSMRYRRPHIVTEPEGGRIVAVNWAPAFEGPLDVDEKQIDAYYAAYITFGRLLDQSPTRVEVRLNPGDLVCFNNRRILHARHKFDLNGGIRHLKGCYINIDEFKSRIRVLLAQQQQRQKPAEQYHDVTAVKHVFNNCWM